MMRRRDVLFSTIAALGASAMPRGLRAQDKFPSRPIRLIIPYGPGGGTDIVGRLVADQMRQTLGQPIVVENRPGANGLLVAKSFGEFVEYAKNNPGKIRYTSTGVGSFPHFDLELLAKRAELKLVHIPNSKGAAASVQDLASGDAQVGMMNVATALPQVKAGNVRVLAIADTKRHPDYPDTPTLAELGFPGIGTVQWFALLTHASAPSEAIRTLHAAALKAVESSTVQEAFRKQGISPSLTKTVEDAKAWTASEYSHWRTIIKEVDIQVGD